MKRSDFETAISRFKKGERPWKFVTPDWYLIDTDGISYPLKYVYAMARDIDPVDTHTDVAKIAAHDVGYEVFNSKDSQSVSKAYRPTNYWWVNHKRTYKREIQRGFIWSPKANRDGGRSEAYESMTKIRAGDVIISYADTKVRAVGIAKGAFSEAPIPEDYNTESDYWDEVGWRVPIEWAPLSSPISPKLYLARIGPLLPIKYSPLRATGDGNQGRYLSSISEGLALVILDIAKLQSPASLKLLNISTELEDELNRRVEDQQEEAIKNDPALPETVKKQLVNARIGQGKFRMNAFFNEPRCRLTGVSDVDFLTASHIKPWKDCNNYERLDGSNGLMLAPHVDRLFDRGWISFEDNGDVIVSQEALPVFNAWGLSEVKNAGEFTDAQRVYLSYHRRVLLRS